MLLLVTGVIPMCEQGIHHPSSLIDLYTFRNLILISTTLVPLFPSSPIPIPQYRSAAAPQPHGSKGCLYIHVESIYIIDSMIIPLQLAENPLQNPPCLSFCLCDVTLATLLVLFMLQSCKIPRRCLSLRVEEHESFLNVDS